MKREHIESLSELCREWLKLDNSTRNNQISVSSEWDFEELDEEYINKTRQNVEEDIFEIVEELCQK